MGENEKTMSLADAISAGWDAAVAEEPAAEEAVQAEEAPAETPAETPVETPAETQVPEQLTNEAPPETPVQQANPLEAQNAQLMQMIQQQQAIIQQLTAQNQQNSQALQQQSQLAEEAVNKAMEPEPYPQLDWNAVRYMEAEQQDQAVRQWQQAMMERVTRDAVEQAMGQMAPIREQYEANRRMAENDAARVAVFGDPRFADFADRRDSIEQVISATPALQGLAPTERYVIGGLMDRGLRHANAPTTEEILTMARANPDVMKALAAQQATEMAQAQAGVPKIAASSGMAQAQAIPENRPKSVKELGEALLKGLTVR